MNEPVIHCLYDKLENVKSLKIHPKNRNQHPKDQIERLAKILGYQGWRYPIKVSKRSGFITSGHGRLAAAKLNGWSQVPINFQDYDSDEQELADLTSDNAIALWAELDFSGINADLENLGPDFDIELLGLKNFTVDVADKAGLCDEDEIPEKVEPKTKRGDIYQLGQHRLMCGDSTAITDVEMLMAGEKADMVFTDPPYGIGYEYNGHDDSDAGANCKMVWDVFAFHDCGKVWTPGLMNLARDIERFGKAKVAVWYKKFAQAGNGIGGASTWEPILILNPHEKRLPNDVLTVMTEREMLAGKSLREHHSCPKPVNLFEQLIAALSKAEDLIAEPFCGSGSTLIACEKTGRKCFGMEIDPIYVDVIVARWEKYTGQKAKLTNSDKTAIHGER